MKTPTPFNLSFASDRIIIKGNLSPISEKLNPHEVRKRVMDDLHDIHKAYDVFQSLAQIDFVQVLKNAIEQNQIKHTRVPFIFISHFKTDSLITINLGVQDYMDIVGVSLKHNPKPAMVFEEVTFNSKPAGGRSASPQRRQALLMHD